MSPKQIEIKDSLIQGEKGQPKDTVNTLVKMNIDPNALTSEILKSLFNKQQSILYYDHVLYYFDAKLEPPLSLIEVNADNQTKIKTLLERFNDLPTPSAVTPDQATLDIYNELIQKKPLVASPNRIQEVADLIKKIAFHTNTHRESGCITRSITDEFSFYPKISPFSLDEYKQIINEASFIAETLEPDVHLVLATFPVLWPDGGIHNCGLYVQPPKGPGEPPIIHHFSKKSVSDIDLTYKKADGTEYALTTDNDCTEEQLPDILLENTSVMTGDTNQYKSALKIQTSNDQALIVSIGICLDHSKGLERTEVHGLISQLEASEQSIPFYCSHVITSASIDEKKEHTLSTLSHADPKTSIRRPEAFPNRSGFTASSITSSFSDTLTTEVYPPKPIGTLHSDLFQHIVANKTESELKTIFNQQNSDDGNTMLHQVFLETDFDNELIAKRLYALVLNGGDPDIKNNQGQSARDLAEAIERSMPTKMLSKAIDAAIAWRKAIKSQNNVSCTDKRISLTREASSYEIGELQQYIMNGANPYAKDGLEQSLLDVIHTMYPKDIGTRIESIMLDTFKRTQYGYGEQVRATNEGSWFDQPPPPKTKVIIDACCVLLEKMIVLEPTNLNILNYVQEQFKRINMHQDDSQQLSDIQQDIQLKLESIQPNSKAKCQETKAKLKAFVDESSSEKKEEDADEADDTTKQRPN